MARELPDVQTMTEALAEYGRAHQAVLEALRGRDEHRCEHFYRGSDAPDDPMEPHCWDSGAVLLDWCEPCQKRQPIHETVRQAKQVRAKAKRRVTALAVRIANSLKPIES